MTVLLLLNAGVSRVLPVSQGGSPVEDGLQKVGREGVEVC